MSNDELEFLNEEDEVEINDNSNILDQKELIALVKSNEPLYVKNKKEYSGKNFNKYLAWESVGKALTNELSGTDASKQFYKIRQKFGKEWRKYIMSLKGKSGQAAGAPYVSTWPLFDDCRFLVQHIQPRNSYKSVNTIPLAAQVQQKAAPLRKPQGRGGRITFNSHLRSSPSPTPSCSWSTDLDDSMSSINDDDRVFSPPPTPVSSDKHQLSSDDNAASPAAQSVLKEMDVAVKGKRTCPEPDNFAKKKKQEDDNLMNSMLDQSKALTSIATEVSNALKGCGSDTQQPTAADPILGAIGFALKSVHEEKKMACMLDLLTLINTKYVNS